jgi:hypothetical protein
VGSFAVYKPAILFSSLVGGPEGGVEVSPINTSLSWAVPVSVSSNFYELIYSKNQNFVNSQVIAGPASNSVVIP